ncbi:0c82ce2d-26cf-476e-8914-0ca15ab7d1b9 [Thermothielavioides terrestris]|uniref:0c82ce2d-26cf-476e-8914-0ca15ab7d1b9 n=1 Tax=Thermothielavioides terrestris TaxID=2587410 RepID=A0A446BHX0_9PEZI|nr:0c82ce2d-26cf-476e-8914-0ca15ab7d1b9 [Thermothielavioides terrestris]
MEMVIPPRDHGPSTYRYTWDENGEVTQVTRIRDERAFSTERLTPGRQTAQWPFQSVVTDIDIPSPVSPLSQQRRATTHSSWQPYQPNQPYQPYRPPQNSDRRCSEGTEDPPAERDIVPDYVVNFMRGETPETVSRRKRSTSHGSNYRYHSIYGGGVHTVTPQHGVADLVVPQPQDLQQQHRSHVADFEGFHVRGDSLPSLERVDSREGDEQQRFLAAAEELGQKTEGEAQGHGGNSRWWWWRCCRSGGWRAGMALGVLATIIILIAGFVCLVVAISGVALKEGRLLVFEGSCTTADQVNWGLHAVINVFVAVLVAAANYTFQVLSSPTRDEVTAAHRRKEWLDIGVPSFRNLGSIRGSRTLLAVVVLATAVSTQIMYNAVIFVSQTAPNFKAAVVDESFVSGAPLSGDVSAITGGLSTTDLSALQQLVARGELVRLSAPACIDQFGGAFEPDYSTVLLISNAKASPLSQTPEGTNLVSDQSAIQYCLAQPAPAPTCAVNLNSSLLGTVALLNSIALVATGAVLFKHSSSFRPLATLGDAISSFLDEPDPETQGACLLSKTDVCQGRWPLTEAKYWEPKHHYWLRSVSFPRWIVALLLWATCVGLATAGLAVSVNNDPAARLSPFGTASPHALALLPAGTPAAAAAVVASLPQLLLALLYFAVHALLASYYLSHESSLFATRSARPLRVSADSVGAQTTSLYLALPIPISGALAALFATMSFLLSQSFFPVSVQLLNYPLDPANNPTPSSSSSTIIALGLSGTALLALLVLLGLLATAVLALGLRRAPAAAMVNGELRGNPMALPAGSCSAVISARCHPLARERAGLSGKPVMWGVVREGVGFGVSHCGFTAGRAGLVEAGRNYA